MNVRSVSINPVWRAEIEGEDLAIKALCALLESPARDGDDFCIWWYNKDTPTLTTTRWNSIEDAAQVVEAAQVALDLFSGLMHIYNYNSKFNVGTIYQTTPNEGIKISRITRVKLNVYPATNDRLSSGNLRKALTIAEEQDWAAAALLEFSNLQDWPSIYKAIEAIEAIEVSVGGEKKMVKSTLFDGRKLKKIKRTANTYRHLSKLKKHRNPSYVIDITEAEKEVGSALKALLSLS